MVKVITWTDCGLPPASAILDAASITKSGLIYTSGSVGMDSNGNIPENVEEQTEIAIENLKIVLKIAGSSINSVVKALVFVTDPSLIPAVNQVYAKHFLTKPPRSCVVAALAGPKFKVEIELVAELE
jgi:2-iminobutanoate/2-iminopropanoate deaminase